MIKKSVWIAFVSLFASLIAQAGTVRVKMAKEATPSGVTYRYRVFNNAQYPIASLHIGYDYYHGLLELREFPNGWTNPDQPATGVSSPVGWTSRVYRAEEELQHAVEWYRLADNNIPAGQVGSGFSVSVPASDATYETGHWTIYFDNSVAASGAIEQDDNAPLPDTLPPVLNVSLSPQSLWPVNRKLVTIQATIDAHDNVDPHPSVRLVSITSNETLAVGDVAGATLGTDDREFQLRAWRNGNDKPGREYRVMYSATDASGNVATVTKIVRVPHDQR
jgi:hypothetical protein